MKSKILFALSLILGLMMINSGLNKIFQYMALPEMPTEAIQLMQAFAESGWMMPLLAAAEITGGLLFIIPKYRALGAIIVFPVVLGIALFHITLDPANTIIGIVLLAINLWVIYENRAKYMPMIQST